MDIDDPRLVQAHKEMTERVEKYDERIVTVLKGHLGAEQALNDLLAAASRRWKKRTFAGKIDIGEKLLLDELHPHVWKVLRAGNDLRSAVAHGHKEGTIAARMTDLRKAYKDSLTPERKGDAEKLTDTQLVVVAFTMASSFLVVAADRLEQKRKKKG
jgi:hypothetical protein